MDIQAAVLRSVNGPFVLETVNLDPPGPDEILVELVATGICHTDLAVRDGTLPFPPLPAVLGHEGAGRVAALGAAVREFAIGDPVVLSFAHCDTCPSCGNGAPAHCATFLPLNFMGARADGSCALHAPDGGAIHGHFFGQSSFATHAVVKASDAVKVGEDIPLEWLGPLGCGIQTGAGTILNTLKPRPDQSVAIFGVGAVGLSAVMAARLLGCAPIIAIDIRPDRLALALGLGADHAIDPAAIDAVSAIQALTGGLGAEATVEARGRPQVVAQAIRATRRGGEVALVGLGRLDAPLPLVLGDLLGGAVIRAVVEGDSVPASFIPALIEHHRQGRFPFERLLSFYPFEAIDQAIHDAETGKAIKPVLRMPVARL